MRVLCVVLLSCALLFTVAGCPTSAEREVPELVPVSGTITLDDEPVSGVSVMFGGIAFGETDENGRYELMYKGQEKGIPVGEYPVVFEKWVMPDGSLYRDAEGISPEMAGAKQALPGKYAHETSSELIGTVPAGGGTVDFALESGGGSAGGPPE